MNRSFLASAIFLPLATLIAIPAFAQDPKTDPMRRTTELLWPDGPPGAGGKEDGDFPQLIITQVESEVPTAAVVILPGGGYHGHAMGHEGYQFADWFAAMGIPSAICTYRLRGKGNDGKGYGHPRPMQDAQRAIQTLRARAKEFNIDPDRVGVIGFSAGGHLCSTVSTHFLAAKLTAEDPIVRVSSRPDFSILCYPVIAFDKPYTHRGSQQNLIGDNPDPKLIEELSNERQVTSDTPPTFIFHTAADKVVPVENSLQYYLALQRNRVPSELHVFPEGRHGVGLAQQLPGASQWPGLCKEWLKRLGMLPTP
ncbi:MAG: alpha/beta hydrolase [Rubripirellula sp.]|nr:1,4-beta-xylanase [Rhodopirellula sp.]MCH1440560.1 alpha/beta hydrolase [Rubripirellula sp.]OUX08803.1 MAG: 1,4-beta-xylanase [Planctomycetaceae bacterium TMED240]